MDTETDSKWFAVIGKSLAYLCFREAQLNDRPMLEKAAFLEGLGLTRQDAAEILGTTAASLNELSRRNKGRRGNGKGKKAVRKRN